MKYLLIVFVLICFFNTGHAQHIIWAECFGGSNDESANSVIQASDNNILVAGWTTSSNNDVHGHHGNKDVWVLKLTTEGDTVWTKCYGGSSDDYASEIMETADNGFIIAGATESADGDVTGNHGSYDFWLLKLNSDGDSLWTKCLGGTDDDRASDIITAFDGNYVVTGFSSSTDGDVSGNDGSNYCWTVKINSTGDTLWTQNYSGIYAGSTESRMIYKINETANDSLVVTGGKLTNDNFWVVKADASGVLLWERTYGGSYYEYAFTQAVTHENNIIVAGKTTSTDGDVHGNHGEGGIFGSDDFWVLMLDAGGDTLWTKCYGGTEDEVAYSVIETHDNNYVIAGTSNSNDGDVLDHYGTAGFGPDQWIIKIDGTGNILWSKNFGCWTSDMAYSIIELADDNFIVAGNAGDNGDDVTGYNGGLYDMWVVKFTDIPVTISNQIDEQGINIYPVPTHGILNIKGEKIRHIELYSLSGELIINTRHKFLDFSEYQPGTYTLIIVTEDNTRIVKKVVYAR